MILANWELHRGFRHVATSFTSSLSDTGYVNECSTLPRLPGRPRRRLAGKGKLLGRKLLREYADIEPAPERHKEMSWNTFLKAHGEVLAAADFFTVKVLTIGGLVRYSVLFVMELSTRRVHIAGTTCQPNQAWLRNMARHLTDAFDGLLLGKRHIVLDRDPLFTEGFRSEAFACVASGSAKLTTLLSQIAQMGSELKSVRNMLSCPHPCPQSRLLVYFLEGHSYRISTEPVCL